MLSPEQIEEAGERVAAVYREIEARMLDHMARAMAEGLGASQATVTAAALLAQSQGEELRRMLDGHGPMVDAAVRDVVEEMLEASDADDAARCGGSPEWPRQVDATIAGISEVLARDNIQMVEGAKQAFLGASIEAVTRVNAGAATREQAVHRAVRRLERDGIDVVTYQDAETGRVTMRNKADVAVRRHVRTQIAQDGARLTMERMERLGVDLVEVSSHSDSRPEHAAWQGRCYSLRGERTIDGTVYPDLAQATGYGTVTGLMGANCRHSFGPYRHGAPRAYEPDPRHPSGLPGAEVYELEQGQRYRERKIREAKRELRGAQVLYERDKSAANLDAANKAGQKLRNRQEKMRAYIDGANAKSRTGKPVLHRRPDREWAGDMPKSKMPASANRTLPQLLGTPSAKRAIAGLDKKAVTAAVGEEMARRGGTVAHFRSLSPGDQQGVLRGAIASVRAKMDGTAKASKGAHADTLAGVVRGEPMSFERADGGRVNPGADNNPKRWFNCQSCVVAFEARLRGYDVAALPYASHGAAKELAEEYNRAWIDPETGARPQCTIAAGANTPRRVLSFLEEHVKEGRYTLRFSLDIDTGDGHIVSVHRNESGALRIYDPQTGNIYEDAAMRNYIKTFKLKGTVAGLKIERPVELLRVDDKEFNRALADQVLEEAR